MFNQNQLKSLLNNLNVSNNEVAQKIEVYIENLKKWNKTLNLTSKNFNVLSHTRDSLMFLEFFKDANGKLLDIGSGNGFPAIILAIVCKGLNIVMIESNARKCAFLRDTILKISLNALVINENILNVSSQETFDFICLRGLKCNNRLETKIYSLLKESGSLLIWAYPPPMLKKFTLRHSINKNNKYLHLYTKAQEVQQPI